MNSWIKMNTEIYIATHKAFNFPEVEGYIPIHVGKSLADINLNILTDNTGENISELNRNFCELTALYWMWKNSNADVLGLVHYRRYFTNKVLEGNQKPLILDDLIGLPKNSIILPVPERFFKKNKKIFNIKYAEDFYTVKEQFCLNHCEEDWNLVRGVIYQRSPEYIKAFDLVSKSKRGISFYNMFIGPKDVISHYATWLFDILFALNDRKDIGNYDNYQKRLYGFLSERLLNVYVEHHKKGLNVIFKPIYML